jgi:hypothetical protein
MLICMTRERSTFLNISKKKQSNPKEIQLRTNTHQLRENTGMKEKKDLGITLQEYLMTIVKSFINDLIIKIEIQL